MLRFKLLASTIPMIMAGLFAGSELRSTARPCIYFGETSVQIAPDGGPSTLHVGFTSDPARATVRVQIVDSAEAADFVYVDDIEGAETDACEVTAATRFVTIGTAPPAAAGPVIYLSRDGNADYRIFVSSKGFSQREAAALIVGAEHGSNPRITAAAL